MPLLRISSLSLVVALLSSGAGCSKAEPSDASPRPETAQADAMAAAPEAAGRSSLREVPSGAANLPERLGRALELSRDYLTTYRDPAGRFLYLQHLDGRDYDPARYNVLRHAGTLYTLGMLERSSYTNTQLKTALRDAGNYLLARHIRKPRNFDEARVAFSWPEQEQTDTGVREAKLGAGALALLGLAEFKRIDDDAVDVEFLQSLGAFIIFMQKPDGSFHNKFSELRHFDVDFPAKYAASQSILALTRLDQLDPNPRWRTAAAKAVLALARERAGLDDAALVRDHWLLLALREFLPHYEGTAIATTGKAIRSDEVYALAVRTGEAMLAEHAKTHSLDDPVLRGAFDHMGRCAAAATRIQGLVALHDLAGLRGDRPLQTKIEPVLASAADFSLRCQVSEGRLAGGIVAAAQAMPGEGRDVTRFNARQREIRVDRVQHAVAAWLGVARICAAGCPRPTATARAGR